MRRITVWALTTLSALVLLLSYRTSTMGVGGEAVAASAPSSAASSSSASEPAASASASASAAAQTFTGDAVDTRWGAVQVAVTVEGGKVTDVQAVEYPTENHRDEEINSYALPQLRQEVLEAQSPRRSTPSAVRR